MSKGTFRQLTKQNHVFAEVSKVINKGTPEEKKLYNLYMLK